VARVVVLSLGLVVASAACEGSDEVIGSGRGAQEDGGGDGTCPAFVPGTNMLGETWTDDPEAAADTAAVVQTIGDVVMGVEVVLTELGAACDALTLATGGATSPPSDGATAEDTQRRCDDAVRTLATWKASASIETAVVSPPSCDVPGGVARCLETCTDDPTCDPFCTSAAIWHAPCSPAVIELTVAGSGSPEQLEAVPAIEAAYGRVAAANERATLVMEHASTLTGTSASGACVLGLVDSLEASVDGAETANTTVLAVFAAIGL
jgi:hypothetical protein